ncbi:unnamed protein product, partial [Rotaria sp. Silwood1]
MAAANNTVTRKHGDNLETFSLLWLDAEVNTKEENRRAQKRLRSIINYLKIFQDQNECQQYIKSCSEQDRIVLISSGRLGKELIPQIHDLRQLSDVYIYCWDKKAYKHWAKQFSKIKGVIVSLDDLVQQITMDQKDRGKVEEPMSMNIYNASGNLDKTTTELNGHFIHSLLLIDVLIKMKSSDADKKKLIQFCKDEYYDNEPQLAVVGEFERDYKSRKALWWYTRDAFVYSMLNKALRIQNTELLLLFRFVIRDIYQRLKKYQCENLVTVYRYQAMSRDELNALHKSIGQFISINSFFSTSADRDVALRFSNRSTVSNDLHRILFEIEADPHVVKSKPFADITSLSYFRHESEILFMVGCIFRLINVYRDDSEKIWIIKMQLAENNDDDLKKLFDQLKSDYGVGENETDLQTFDSSDFVYIGGLHCCIGNIHMEKNDFNQAMKCYSAAMDCYKRGNITNHRDTASLYHGIARVHYAQKQYPEALNNYQRSLDILQQNSRSTHPDAALNHSGIGDVYRVT